MEQVSGYIERITFQNDENGYTVAQLQAANRKDLITIVGLLPELMPGVTIKCLGSWKQHLLHGNQFDVQKYSIEAPADLIGIKKYLGSGLIRGIGPAYAEKIVEQFGLDTLDIIDRNPEALLKIKGLGKKKLAMITHCWKDQKTIRDVMVFLQGHGVSPAYAQKIYKTYAQDSIKQVQENPYKLARDILGIGFKTADTIANKMGIQKDALIRIDSGIEYALSELSNEGHVCFPLVEFLPFCEKLLEVTSGMIEQRLHFLTMDSRIEIFEIVFEGVLKKFIWFKPLFLAETGIAREIKRLSDLSCVLRQVDVQKALIWVQEKLQINLAYQQAKAVELSLSEKVLIITGGPGTGKSTITNAVLKITEKLTTHIILAAPTGRAAKRLSEITGRKAKTIHSLLEFDFKNGGFKRKKDFPLECDLIIVDEASMMDTLLMNSLLKAIPDHCRVIFVGDIHQLPSVGPGNVLKEMIASNQIPVVTLTEIFRQAQGSRIITNAHSINSGHFPDIRFLPNSDFYFIEALEPEHVLKEIISLVAERLPHKYGFNPFHEIQVLAPMKRGLIGTENLNAVLQKHLNPKENALLRGGKRFSVGDKVMQIRNNYQKEVFNGDIGIVKEIHTVDQEMIVTFDEVDHPYEFSELDELVLAYAVSIHKYQGSECPCVILPIHTTHFKLLHRNLLYTGVTRGKKLVILVGTKKALAIAVNNDEVKKRYTGLKQALLGYL